MFGLFLKVYTSYALYNEKSVLILDTFNCFRSTVFMSAIFITVRNFKNICSALKSVNKSKLFALFLAYMCLYSVRKTVFFFTIAGVPFCIFVVPFGLHYCTLRICCTFKDTFKRFMSECHTLLQRCFIRFLDAI